LELLQRASQIALGRRARDGGALALAF